MRMSTDFSIWFLRAAFVMLLDCAWIVESLNLLPWLVSLFSLFIEGLHSHRQKGHFYIYIQAWLLIQGVQFSTDHGNDPFCVCVCFKNDKMLDKANGIHREYQTP